MNEEFDDIFDDDVDFEDLLAGELGDAEEDPESDSIKELMKSLNHTHYSDKFVDYFKVTTLLVNAAIDDQVSRMNNLNQSAPLMQTAVEMLLEEFYGSTWKHLLVARHLEKMQMNSGIEELRHSFEGVLEKVDEAIESIDPEEDEQSDNFFKVFKSNISAVLFCLDVLDNYIDRTVERFSNSPEKLIENMSGGDSVHNSSFEENLYLEEIRTVLHDMINDLQERQVSVQE